jgi:hypothetical protein
MKIYRISARVSRQDHDLGSVWTTERDAMRALADQELGYLHADDKAAIIHDFADDDAKHHDGFYNMSRQQEYAVCDRYMADEPRRREALAKLAKMGVHLTLRVDHVEGEALRDALVDNLPGLDIPTLTEVTALKLMEPEHA